MIPNTHMARPFISMRVTEKCNFRCKYCINTFDAKSMSVETALDSLTKIKQYFQSIGVLSFDILFNGGEPLLEPDLIFAVMEQLPSECEGKLLTNGSQLEGLRKLLPFKDRITITISLDGAEETQLLNREHLVSEEFLLLAQQFRTVALSRTLAPNTIRDHHKNYQYLLNLLNNDSSFVVNTLCVNADWSEVERQCLKDCLTEMILHDVTLKPRTLPFLFTWDKSKKFIKDKDVSSCCNRSFTVLTDGTFCKCLIDFKRNEKEYEFGGKCDIAIAGICGDCKYRHLCNNCSMAFASDPRCPDSDAGSLRKSIAKGEEPIICFFTRTLYELLEKYGQDLLWNSYAWYKKDKLLNVLLDK